MSESYHTIRLERRELVAEVILERPGQLNSMDRAFFHEIRRAFEEFQGDDSVRVVLIWAEGRAFSTGLNLKESIGLLAPRAESDSDASRNHALLAAISDFQDCFQRVRNSRKPVIAAINGLCLGGGLDLATACDIRLCSAEAVFAIQETKMAMVADLGTLQRIANLAGRGIAREMAFTGRPLPAQRALAAGLVNEIYPDKQSLLQGARQLANEIAANSPLAIQGIKKVLDYCEEHTEREGLEFVALWNSSFFFSQDLQEASRAFMEKRSPRFEGK